MIPVLCGALAPVLTEGHLQSEHGDAQQQQTHRVWDEERTWCEIWSGIAWTLIYKTDR